MLVCAALSVPEWRRLDRAAAEAVAAGTDRDADRHGPAWVRGSMPTAIAVGLLAACLKSFRSICWSCWLGAAYLARAKRKTEHAYRST